MNDVNFTTIYILPAEIEEAKSELEMNRARHEIMAGQLIGMGGTLPNENNQASNDMMHKNYNLHSCWE